MLSSSVMVLGVGAGGAGAGVGDGGVAGRGGGVVVLPSEKQCAKRTVWVMVRGYIKKKVAVLVRTPAITFGGIWSCGTHRVYMP